MSTSREWLLLRDNSGVSSSSTLVLLSCKLENRQLQKFNARLIWILTTRTFCNLWVVRNNSSARQDEWPLKFYMELKPMQPKVAGVGKHPLQLDYNCFICFGLCRVAKRYRTELYQLFFSFFFFGHKGLSLFNPLVAIVILVVPPWPSLSCIYVPNCRQELKI